jgi:hypothetical protein
VSGKLRFDDLTVLQQSRAKQSLIVCRFYRRGARRQNRTVPAYGLPPITARRFRLRQGFGGQDALLTASLGPPRFPDGNEIAIPAVSEPKGHTIYWAEIGAAWANKDGKASRKTSNHLR